MINLQLPFNITYIKARLLVPLKFLNNIYIKFIIKLGISSWFRFTILIFRLIITKGIFINTCYCTSYVPTKYPLPESQQFWSPSDTKAYQAINSFHAIQCNPRVHHMNIPPTVCKPMHPYFIEKYNMNPDIIKLSKKYQEVIPQELPIKYNNIVQSQDITGIVRIFKSIKSRFTHILLIFSNKTPINIPPMPTSEPVAHDINPLYISLTKPNTPDYYSYPDTNSLTSSDTGYFEVNTAWNHDIDHIHNFKTVSDIIDSTQKYIISNIDKDHWSTTLEKYYHTETQCYKRLCDTTQEDICSYKIQDPKLIAELGGALTHKVPLDKEGVLLDTIDGDGKPKPQYMIKEKTAIPKDMTTFKENEKMTEYVQQKHISEKIGKNLPANSILNLKNTSMVDTPTDDFA